MWVLGLSVDRDDVLCRQHAGASERDSVQTERADSADGHAEDLRYARPTQAGHSEARVVESGRRGERGEE